MIKFIINVFLSTLLITAIMAPSVVTILDLDCKSWSVIDLNDDENKQENKKELNEKDVFFYILESGISAFPPLKTSSNPFYIEKGYSHVRDIFLPPPKYA
ncbi:hypothetical protein [Spongiimicrobium salis]|uniref:hypothetical protein n=1 Tax=Spongiimicrobium salis TaxID=1667022 RepID=UPI00374D5498